MKKILCIITVVFLLSGNVTSVYALSGLYESKDELKSKTEQALKDYDEAKNSYEDKLEQYNAVKSEVASLEEELESDKQELPKVESDKPAKYSALEQSLNSLNSKQSELATKREAYEKACTDYNKGSIGFFEYVGATDAINAIRTCKYASYTSEGAANDATGLENMKEAITFVKKGNEYRAKEGTDPQNGKALSDLLITDYMMATAQADANYSTNNIAHAVQFDVAENLAWGYPNPYTGWYDAEKAEYQSGVREFMSIGHYINLVNSSYGITGFAYARGGMYGYVHGQTFLWSTSSQKAYTYDEYYNRFMEYYNRVTSEMNILKPEIDSLNATISSLESESSSLRNEYDGLCNKAESLRQSIAAKEQDIPLRKTNLSSLEDEVRTLYSKMISLEKTYEDYAAKYNKLAGEDTYVVQETWFIPDDISKPTESVSETTENEDDKFTESVEISFPKGDESKKNPTQPSTKKSTKEETVKEDETEVVTIGEKKSKKNNSANKVISVCIGIGVLGIGAVALRKFKD